MLVALLALAGLFLSLYLTLFKLGYIGHLACAAGSCERVQTSHWSVLIGVPVAGWGVAFYLAVLSVSVAGTQQSLAGSPVVSRLLTAMTAAGVLFSAYLTSLELFVIHATCIYCVASACIVTAMLVLSVAELRGAKE
jgi:uncharacterized membrane protein